MRLPSIFMATMSLTIATGLLTGSAQAELLTEFNVILAAKANPSLFDTVEEEYDYFTSGQLQVTDTSAIYGDSDATLTYNMTQDASGIAFDFQSAMTRPRTYNASTSVNMVFYALEDMTYDLSGAFALTNNSGYGGLNGSVQLTEVDLNLDTGDPPVFTDLLYDRDISRDVAGGTQFTVGMLDEGNINYFPGTGSTTGTIRAGYGYQFLMSYTVFDDERYFSSDETDPHPEDQAGSGIGFARFTLTPTAVSAVPEPSSMILIGIGACGLGVASRRRWKRVDSSDQ